MEIARPFAEDMKLLKHSLIRKFNQYVPFKVSFTFTVIVFIVSLVLHLAFMYVCHRFNLRSHFPETTHEKFVANQQLYFNFDTVSSLLLMIHASVKSYRSAFFAFHMKILNSIPVLLKGHLPISLFPKESLLAIMDSVSLRQSKAEDRLGLAIPASDLLSYYDSRLLVDAITVAEGLLLTLNIPLASQQTVFELFEAKLRYLLRTTLRLLLHGTLRLRI